MSFTPTDLAIPYWVTAVDNGLLCGILLPHGQWSDWKRVTAVIVALQFTQWIMIVGVQPVLRIPAFMLAATVALAWVSVQTMVAVSWTNRRLSVPRATLRMFAFGVIGNLDDVLWIGAKVDERFLQAGLFTAVTVPLTVFIVVALAQLCQQHRWVLVIAAVTTAYAGSELYIQTQPAQLVATVLPAWGNQLLFVAVVSLIGMLCLLLKSTVIRY